MSVEQKTKQQEYSEKLRIFYEKEYQASGAAGKKVSTDERIRAIRKSLDQAARSVVESFDQPLTTGHRGLVGKAILFVKRFIRKATRFLLAPYADKVYQYQINTLEAIDLITDYMEEIAAQVKASDD